MPLVLGVASSPRGASVELRDSDDGRVYGTGRGPVPHDAVSTVEQDPALWWQALVDARHDAGGALGISGIAVAATVPGLVAVDGNGRLLRPARLAGGRAARSDARALVDRLGPTDWLAATGSVPDAATPIAQLAWLRRSEPDAYARVAGVLAPPDWLTFRLGRRAVTDRGAASTTGFWSPREEQWRADLLALVDDQRDWGASLPRVIPSGEPVGDRDGVLIAAGTGDVMSAAVGLGLAPHDVGISLGSPSAVFALRERPTEDPTGSVRGYAGVNQFLPCARALDVDATITSFTRLLGVERAHFDRLALHAPLGANGMVFAPPARSGDPGTLAGIPDDVGPELIARAVLEGVACSLLDSLDHLRAADVPIGGSLSLVGDPIPSRAFAQLLADLAQRPVAVPKGDRVATGACVLAASVVTGRPAGEIAAAWRLGEARVFEPDPRVPGADVRAQVQHAWARVRGDEGDAAAPSV